MEFAKADDRRVFILVDRSGGRPDFDRLAESSLYYPAVGTGPFPQLGDHPGVVQLVQASLYYRDFTMRAIVSVVGHWLAHWVIFRRGWAVHIDAPDRDPVKIRCANRAEAEARAHSLAVDIDTHGPEILDRLR